MIPGDVIEASKAMARAICAHITVEQGRELAELEWHLHYLRGWKHGTEYAKKTDESRALPSVRSTA
jgi:hypothetical protein